MKHGPFAASALALLAVLATSSADSGVLSRRQQLARAPEGAQLMAFGGRSAEQRSSPRSGKLDSALADLSVHLDRVRSDHALEDLHALNPAARFTRRAGSAVPMIAVDAVTRGDPVRLKEQLIGLGMQHAVVFSNDVGGWLPVDQIGAAAALGHLAFMHASMPHARAAVTSQGDFAQRSDVLRANNTGLNGAGVTVGILSDSFNCYGVYDKPGSGVPAVTANMTGYAQFGFATDDAPFDETNGYLPASVTVLEEGACMDYTPAFFLPYADEGRAMMQIVHDVAPGAALAFYTGANSQADFASGIGALAAAGAKVIADDIGYYDEPFFQDGIIAQAINAANAKGVAYFSAAGNNASLSYENSAASSSFVTAGSGQNAGEMLLTFGMSSGKAQTTLPIVLPPKAGTFPGGLAPGEFLAIIVEWDQPYITGAPDSGGATSQIDICVTGAPNSVAVLNLDSNSTSTVTCTGANANGVDSEQVLVVGNPASNSSATGPATINLIIGLKNGSPAPGLIKVVVADDGAGSTIGAFDTQSPTLQGHPGAAGAAAVGAAFFAWTPRCGTSPATLESFSSAGGDPILFDASGKPAAPQVRQKPEFVGPDGVNTSFFGFPISGTMWNDTSTVGGCQNDATYNNFLGTSAATPHAAGIAALMLQANPALTPAQIFGALQSTALAMPVAGHPTPDYLSGYGFIQADAAMASLPPGPPVMQFAASSIAVGSSTKLTWSAYNVTSCSASGSWSGSQSASGSLTVTPAATGTENYTLTCMNPHGSAQHTATLTVQAASAGGGGGGGGLDGLTLLALMSLGCARALVQRAGNSVRR
jgi:subtilisin family serine protease